MSKGLIGNMVSPDHGKGILVEVDCETDFVARTDDFQQLITDVLAEIDKAGDGATDAWLKDPEGPVHQRVAATIGKLRENMAVPRFVRYAGQGYVAQYIHAGAQVGVQVEIAGVTPAVAGTSELTAFAKEVAMQIAAASLLHARRGARCPPPCSFRKRRAGIYARADGEFRQTAERPRQDRRGQARKLLFAGRATSDQASIRDPKMTVSDVLAAAARSPSAAP